ncbi:MAG: TetR family transcriptional regulator [Chitinophagales bacterium]|nr:TetR family transcriptional regulator [Chitinophagales bacterium]
MKSPEENILDKAQLLFSQKGFSGTSVRDIANEAGVNISMISYYFGGKNGLLTALVKSRLEIMKSHLGDLVENKKLTPQEKIELLIEKWVEKFWEYRLLNNFILRENNFELMDELNELITEVKMSRYNNFRLIILEGQKEGSFKKDLNIPLLYGTLSGFLKHLYFSEDFYCQLLEIEENKDQALLNQMKIYLKSLYKYIINE